jgi:alkanesulfonate monooxygenase SsuD/methylene tetrahydromethanopterin reductase-like flavin-dependent oxidoreductase (luciferase family)
MEISITLEAMMGMDWDLWKRSAALVERLGFAGLFRSDHFLGDSTGELDSLEAFVSLAYLASHTQWVHFGTLVAPFSFRDPVMLARQAMQIDDLSGGRMVLGVGTGWSEGEHTMFGYELGDVKTRLDRLEEGLQVVSSLMRRAEPVTFEGKFYRLKNARLEPRPKTPTRILVGGNGPKRTLPLVARYADVWNCQVASAEVFKERSALLDELLIKEGRQPGDVKRTVMVPVLTWDSPAGLKRQMDWARRLFFGDKPDEAILGELRDYWSAIVGEPEQVVEQMRAYQQAGVEEFILQWFTIADTESLEVMAEAVLPHFAE